MTSAIEPPASADGAQRITVWLRVPRGGAIDARRVGDRWVLAYPPGTVADRVELRVGGARAEPIDVRGTELLGDGEKFHALHEDQHGALEGFAWLRGDASAQDRAIASLAKTVARAKTGDARFFCQTGDCARCHVHDKPERLDGAGGLPPLATDDAGFYRITTVLEDRAPLTESRDRDVNLESPWTSVTCASGPPVVTGKIARCPRGDVPVARWDMRAALAADDPHAQGVCASREWLRARMTERARAAFASALEECATRAASPR
jgi:hypothetical protein